MSRLIWWAFGILTFASAQGALTQEPEHPLQWTRVRVTVWDSPYDRTVTVGILSRITPDSLVLARGARAVRVPRDRVLLVEASDGGNGLKGALAGFGIGAAAGLLAIQMYLDDRHPNDEYNIIIATFAGIPLGGLLGASIGGTITRERWSPVPLSPAKDSRWTATLRFSPPLVARLS
jgi:hypothetical protein